jgi:hypothetical protein
MWGEWCDPCGGVMLGSPPILFFRHVATLRGKGGTFPIVFDKSTDNYAIAWPRLIANVRCIHCGRDTPAEVRKGLTNLDDMRPSGFYSTRGSLNEMIAIGQPLAKGQFDELPEKFVAPSATVEEVEIVNL